MQTFTNRRPKPGLTPSHKAFRLLLFICAVFMPLLPAAAQSATGVLSGRVIAKDGQVLAGISIGLEDTPYGTTTDHNGNFRIDNVPAGTYMLSATGVAHASVRQSVDVQAGQITTVSLQLDGQSRELSAVTVTSDRIPAFTTVNKIAVPMRDMPVTTSSVSARTIEQRGVDNLGDAVKNTTGVRANNTYGGFQDFTIRGFNNFVLLVDGVRDERHNISTSAPSTNLAHIERIEVLKGPASVLFGHSALGGVINLVRKRPTNDFKADFSASYGSFNTRRMRAGVGGPINNKLRYRMDFGLSDTDGYRSSGVHTNNAYFALEYTPTAADHFCLAIGANRDRYDTDTGIPVLEGGVVVPGMNRNTRYNDPGDFLKNARNDFQLRYTRQLTSALEVSDQLSYSYDNINYLSTEELTFNTAMDSLTRTSPLYFNHLTKPLQNQLELTYTTQTGTVEHKLLVGYALSILDRKTYNGDISGSGLYGRIAVQNPILNQGAILYTTTQYRATEETVHGFYVQDWLHFSDKLKGLVGLRYDVFNGTYYTNKVDANRNVTAEGAQTDINKNALTYRAGLVYQPLQILSVYGSYSTYFKPSRRVAPNGETFDPETGYQAEAGSRLEMAGPWVLSGSVYYMRKNNQVEALAGGVYKRIGSAESKGFEIDLQGSIVPGLDLTTGYTFTIAEYRAYKGGDVSAVAGNTVAMAPRNMVNIWANYEFQHGLIRNLNLGAGMNYMDDTYANSANTYVLPAYTVADAAIGYRIDRVSLRLNVNNVFNERYFNNVIITNQFYPGATRNYLVTLKYSL